MSSGSEGPEPTSAAARQDADPAVSYEAAVPGTPVLTASGKEIGTLEHVLEVPELDLFDGIVVATDWGLRFVDADYVDLITVRYVRTTIDDAQASRLPPPDGPAVYRVNTLEEIGDSLHERLGRMFHRPHWTRE
ncbi:MAG TPA: hypothetical protein VG253_13745 [Streptosporangiaceae bacterium]|nr:hypothetical protein [Streptosporangiaceae bacterium]